MKFTGLRNVLRKFDENGWKGRYSDKAWSVGNGGYDLWFEVYYNDQPVAQCIDGVVSSDFGLDNSDKEKMVGIILSMYDGLNVA